MDECLNARPLDCAPLSELGNLSFYLSVVNGSFFLVYTRRLFAFVLAMLVTLIQNPEAFYTISSCNTVRYILQDL